LQAGKVIVISLYDGPKLDALYIYINYGCDNNNVMMVITEKRFPFKKVEKIFMSSNVSEQKMCEWKVIPALMSGVKANVN
jgi:hypothetical protein